MNISKPGFRGSLHAEFNRGLQRPTDVAVLLGIMITVHLHIKMNLYFAIILVQNIMCARYPASRI